MSSRYLNESLGPFFSGAQCMLLTSPEDVEMASIVYNATLEEISCSSQFVNVSSAAADEDEEDDPRVEVSRENLNRIVKKFEAASEAREKFVRSFQLWEALREENIRQLKDLALLMRDDKKKCGTGVIVGVATTLVGAGAITGALLFPPAAPALLPAAVSAYIPAALLPAATAAAAYLPSFLLPAAAAAPAAASGAMAGGIAAASLGGATVAGSAAALIALLDKRAEEARKVIAEDERAFKMCLEEWFRHTQGTIEAIEELMEFDVIEGLVEDLTTVLSWSKDQNGQLLYRKDLFTAGIKLCVVRLLPRLESHLLVGCGVAILASLLTFLFCLFWLKRRSLFRLLSRTWSLRRRLGALDPRELLQAVGTSPALRTVVAAWSERNAASGAFAVFGLIGSAADAVISSVDLKEEGRSKGADAVEKVVAKLEEELDILEEVYNSLVSV